MFNFIQEFLRVTQLNESPDRFWIWAAIGTVSAVLRDNVWIPTITGQVYPNMYIILYGESGVARKGLPCKTALALLREVHNTKVLAGRASMPQVIRELAAIKTEDGRTIKDASGIMYSEELSAFLVADPSSIPLLTELYDYHIKWDNSLVGGSQKLHKVCLSLLSASNSDLFKSVFTDSAVKGGLLGRTFIIKEEKRRRRQSLRDFEGYRTYENTALVEHLKELSKLSGPINLSLDADREYNDWYYNIPEKTMEDKIGFGSRLHTHVLKVAFALAASRGAFLQNKQIILEDIQRAIELVQNVYSYYRSLTIGAGAARSSYQMTLIIKAVLSEGKPYIIERSKLIQRLFGEIDPDVLQPILDMLEAGDIVREQAHNGQVVYQLTAKGMEMAYGTKPNGSENAAGMFKDPGTAIEAEPNELDRTSESEGENIDDLPAQGDPY